MSAISRAFSNVSRRVIATNFGSRSLSISSIAPRILPVISQHKQFQVRNFAASPAEKELQEFLTQEIQMEKESSKPIPKLEGWKVSHDGSEITLSKAHDSEEITVKANICYSVEEENPGQDPESEEATAMICKPDFAIEIRKGSQILGLNCTFYREEEDGELNSSSNDIQINEISLYEGEFQKSNYAISADVIDGNLYDMIMNILEERGIDQKFAQDFIAYSTAYEHKQYVGLLAQLKKFFA